MKIEEIGSDFDTIKPMLLYVSEGQMDALYLVTKGLKRNRQDSVTEEETSLREEQDHRLLV